MVKRFVVFLFSLSLLAACSEREASSTDKQVYPWQIEVTASGKSRVFGITLDESTLLEAATALQQRYELGLFENKQGKLTLEAYFREITRGGVSGKLIITLKTDDSQLQVMKQNSIKKEPQESGEFRYRLASSDQQQARSFTVYSLSYIPYINLDRDIVDKRFGKADKVIKVSEGIEHHVYLEKGLDLRLDDNAKEIMQYVSPPYAGTLLEPLLDKKPPPQQD